MEEKNSKIVFNPGVARRLLKSGCQIIDIKKSRENPVASLFVFLKDEKFDAAMAEITAAIQEKKSVEAE